MLRSASDGRYGLEFKLDVGAVRYLRLQKRGDIGQQVVDVRGLNLGLIQVGETLEPRDKLLEPIDRLLDRFPDIRLKQDQPLLFRSGGFALTDLEIA